MSSLPTKTPPDIELVGGPSSWKRYCEIGGGFIREDTFVKISFEGNVQTRHFFLFKNFIIYSKRGGVGGLLTFKKAYTYRGKIDFDHCLVNVLKDSKNAKNAFEIVRVDNLKKYIICAETELKRNTWASELQMIIEERLSRRSKPPEKSEVPATPSSPVIDKEGSKEPIPTSQPEDPSKNKRTLELSPSLANLMVYLPCPQICLNGWHPWDVVKKNGGKFIRDSSFTEVSNPKRSFKAHLFLFQSFLLYAVPIKDPKQKNIGTFNYIDHMPFGSYLVSDLPDSLELGYCFQLIRVDTKIKYTFACNSLNIKREWMTDLKCLVDDSLKEEQYRDSLINVPVVEAPEVLSNSTVQEQLEIHLSAIHHITDDDEENLNDRPTRPVPVPDQNPIIGVNDSDSDSEELNSLLDLLPVPTSPPPVRLTAKIVPLSEMKGLSDPKLQSMPVLTQSSPEPHKPLERTESDNSTSFFSKKKPPPPLKPKPETLKGKTIPLKKE